MCKLFSSQHRNRGVQSISPVSRVGSLLVSLLALMVLVGSANVLRADTPFERTLNIALETLASGVSATATVGDKEVIVTPLRTWKSITGHYCRQFQVTSTNTTAATVNTEATRCRDNGVWKPVNMV